MTIPTIIASTQEKVAVVQLKKAYSTFESAYRLAVAEDGTPDNWEIGDFADPQGATNIMNKLAPHLKLIKNCANGDDCFKMVDYRFLNGNHYDENDKDIFAKAQLADGSFIFALSGSADCSTVSGDTNALKNLCGFLYVDINGYKAPNQLGRDYFEFILTKYGVIPSGSAGATKEPFSTHCLNKSTGLACTAWVIYNGNMDYMHCNDLDWNGKHKCN